MSQTVKRLVSCVFAVALATTSGCGGGGQTAAPENPEKVKEAQTKSMEEAKAAMQKEMERQRTGSGKSGPPR